MFDTWRNRKTKKQAEEEKERSLTALFNNNATDNGNIVHLAIDVQNRFCLDSYNDIAKKIGTEIAPALNLESIPTYWIYYRHPKEYFKAEKDCVIGPDGAFGGMHKAIKPAANDIFIGKDRDSAIQGSDINILLQKENKDTLIVTGFNYHACVYDTVMDARGLGYNVVLLKDASNYQGPQSYWERVMENYGIVQADSQDVLQRLFQKKPVSFKSAAAFRVARYCRLN